MPEVSGAWTTIRDWFPHPAQDEAALCFRAFYQPDEATSALDRLNHFLKLKALASPAWQDKFTVDRIHGTGETVCASSNGGFSPVTLSLSDQEWLTTQRQEGTADNCAATAAEAGGSAKADTKGASITETQIQTWRDLSPEAKREAGGWRAWARAQGISVVSARNFLANSGLTPFGIARLLPPEKRGSPITNTQIQAWRDLSPAAKREAGGWIKWAQANEIAVSSARTYLTNTGLTPRGAGRLQQAEDKAPPITTAQIQAWRDMTPEAKREAGSCIKWAQAQGISIWSAKNYLTNSGVTVDGVERLQTAEEKSESITVEQILAWFNMSPEERLEAGGWKTWARAQGISVNTARNCLTNTGLTPISRERLQPPEKRGTSITDTQIQAWRDLSLAAKREAGGWIKWVQAQGIAVTNAYAYLTNTGLTPRGAGRLQQTEAPITTTQIQTWRDLSPKAKRKAGGWVKWAQAQGISLRSAGTYLTNTGLTVVGVERLQPVEQRGEPVTEAQLLAWLNMSPEQQSASGGWAAWAQTQGISYRSAKKYLAPTESETPRRGTSPAATVTSDSQLASTSAGGENSPPQSSGAKRAYPLAGEASTTPPAKQIKEEDDAVTWQTHQIDNNLPILQHWRDPTVSVLAQAECQKETLHVTFWGPLFNRLPRETKARINQDIRWFLQHEGNHDARMNAMMSVAIPLDDRDGYRGRTVYARTDLAAYTVLGPYSGRLLENETVRCEYEKEYGKEAGNYYFATRSQERIVSAWPQGNILSLINNPVFTGRTAEAEARQNVSAVLVGKSIHFYLTTRDISAGEELWFDYGPDYRHFEPGEALRSVQIKEEPPSLEAGLL